MMKMHLLFLTTFSLLLTQKIWADDPSCFVIGYHPPGTHQFMGPTWCTHQNFENILVYGPLLSDHSTIGGTSTIQGPLKMTHSQFDVIDMKNTYTPQKVILQNNSEVTGDITFEGPMGQVLVDGTSHVHGKVTNGVVVNN